MNETFELRVAQRAREFELGALVATLRAHGYHTDDVVFQSNRDTGSPRSLVEAVHFYGDGAEQYVVVTLNIGLLGSQSLLPSYFFQALSDPSASTTLTDPEDLFADFIRFFDDQLLHELVQAVCPDQHTTVLGDWNAARLQANHLVGLGCPLGLDNVSRAVFPEFSVRISRGRIEQINTAYSAAIGGPALDGTAVLGRSYESRAAGFFIDLVVEDEVDDYGRPWATIVRQRLHRILLPLLARHELALRVRLTIIQHGRWAHIDEPDAPPATRGDLGSERLRGRVGPHTITIYRGITNRGDPGPLLDLVRARFRDFNVDAQPLPSFSPSVDGDQWPAGFIIRLKMPPMTRSQSENEDVVRRVRERVIRELLPALSDHDIGLIVGLELHGSKPNPGSRTEIIYRGIPGVRR